mmetsp:Transcript_29441/g.71566  ORF Transcript_29441/g.71566 Transcript_29441/m.71566 type:complete len:331 (-) Transcript_29441:331-1323(-)
MSIKGPAMAAHACFHLPGDLFHDPGETGDGAWTPSVVDDLMSATAGSAECVAPPGLARDRGAFVMANKRVFDRIALDQQLSSPDPQHLNMLASLGSHYLRTVLSMMPAQEDNSDDALPKTPETTAVRDTGVRWHELSAQVGALSEDGHTFWAEPKESTRVKGNTGLAPLCMLFERCLRVGGVHQYTYTIAEGVVGAADGVGFVFDSRIRRNNIKKMRSIFLNKKGQICKRNRDKITKLPDRFPALTVGAVVRLWVDLDSAVARFEATAPTETPLGPGPMQHAAADIYFSDLFIPRDDEDAMDPFFRTGTGMGNSGFFCAVVTNQVAISVH